MCPRGWEWRLGLEEPPFSWRQGWDAKAGPVLLATAPSFPGGVSPTGLWASEVTGPPCFFPPFPAAAWGPLRPKHGDPTRRWQPEQAPLAARLDPGEAGVCRRTCRLPDTAATQPLPLQVRLGAAQAEGRTGDSASSIRRHLCAAQGLQWHHL